jgi:hypothetical protein
MNDAPHKRRGRPPKNRGAVESSLGDDTVEGSAVVDATEPVKAVSDAYSRWGALLDQVRNLRAG